MSLELIKESIRINRVVEDSRTQRIIDNDIIVPDSKPDISKVLLLDGEVVVRNIDISEGKLYLTGEIIYKILYLSEFPGATIASIRTAVGFSNELGGINVSKEMYCNIKGTIEHIDFEIVNERKLNIKSVITFNMKVTDEVFQEVASDIKAAEDIEILKNNMNISCYLGRTEDLFNVEETFEIPSGKSPVMEILRDDTKVIVESEKITDNKVILKGKVNTFLLYKSEDEEKSLQGVEYEIPFSQVIDMDGIDEGSYCEFDCTVESATFENTEDSDGENRFINANVDVKISVEGYRKKEFVSIEDVYSTGNIFTVEREKIKILEIADNAKSQFNLKDTLRLGDDALEIGEVYNVLSKPVLNEYRIEDNKVFLEGFIHNRVLYLSNEAQEPLACFEKDTPFKHSFDVGNIGDDMLCEASIDIDNFSYSVASERDVEIRLTVCARAKIGKKNEVVFTNKIEGTPCEECTSSKSPSIIVYFAQQGDSLWKIAKKYRVKVNDLLLMNSLSDSANISTGQQIIIPKYLV